MLTATVTQPITERLERLGLTLSIQDGWMKLVSRHRKVDADCGLDAPGLWKDACLLRNERMRNSAPPSSKAS